METIIYSDINALTPESSAIVTNINSIFQSIYNILNTRKGERVFLPEFGCDLQEDLFELMDDDKAFLILERIAESISRWEPRVFLRTGQSTIIPEYDSNLYRITLVFDITGLEGETFTFKGAMGA